MLIYRIGCLAHKVRVTKGVLVWDGESYQGQIRIEYFDGELFIPEGIETIVGCNKDFWERA